MYRGSGLFVQEDMEKVAGAARRRDRKEEAGQTARLFAFPAIAVGKR